jgi:phosphoglycerol transferase MdoB-like AlkP superfamily enzyme
MEEFTEQMEEITEGVEDKEKAEKTEISETTETKETAEGNKTETAGVAVSEKKGIKAVINGFYEKHKVEIFFFFIVAVSFLLINQVFLKSVDIELISKNVFEFTFVWSFMTGAFVMIFPNKAARVIYCVLYYIMLIYCFAQYCYYCVFGSLFSISMLGVADEGMAYAGGAIARTNPQYDFCYALLFVAGIAVQYFYGRLKIRLKPVVSLPVFACIFALWFYYNTDIPKHFFDGNLVGDAFIMENEADMYAECNDMYFVTGTVGVNQSNLQYMRVKFFADHSEEEEKVEKFFAEKPEHNNNSHTGEFEGKNVVVVLMETIDDWLITEDVMPTLCKMKNNSYWFDNFYTTGIGPLTFNSEYAVNSGCYNPISGEGACLYYNNTYDYSLAKRFKENGYSAESFHGNRSSYYDRGKMHKAWGYEQMNSYQDMFDDVEHNGLSVFDDRMLVLDDEVYDRFAHRSDKFMNYVITISGHFPYVNDETVDEAFEVHPEYKNKTDNEKLNGAMAKARLTDDMFKLMIEKLDEEGMLENTVIIGFTDHYAYDFDPDEIAQWSNLEVNDENMFAKNCLFIYNSDLQGEHVEKVCNTSDVLPTIVNMFGLGDEYPYIGFDIFDDGYDGIAYFKDKSWVTNKGYYNGGIQFANQEISDDEIKKNNEYVDNILKVNTAMVKYDLMPRKEKDK